MSSDDKLKQLLKRFQQERRERRRDKLLQLFVALHEEFDLLAPEIGANITNLLGLAKILHQIDRATWIIKRYKQLADEALRLGLEPPPAPRLQQGVVEAYMHIVGRRPRPSPGVKVAN